MSLLKTKIVMDIKMLDDGIVPIEYAHGTDVAVAFKKMPPPQARAMKRCYRKIKRKIARKLNIKPGSVAQHTVSEYYLTDALMRLQRAYKKSKKVPEKKP